jgi:hypothetical protein
MGRALLEACPLALDVLVVELQQDDSRNADPDDLRQLSGVVGCTVALLPADEVAGYRPGEWSCIPKDVRHRRLAADMSPESWGAVATPDNHDTLDAVCLGRFELTRRGVLR